MAEVYLAERAGAGGVSKLVALKYLLRELAENPEFRELFVREARIVLDFSHGNIVSVFELGETEGSYFLAMEFVRGYNLAKLLGACAAKGTPFPAALALSIASEVAKALAYAHERRGPDGELLGIVHRDVSPANVLVSLEGDVKLTDFGIARAALGPATRSTWVRGKIPYMSPEQARGETCDARTDLYALGVVLFELVTARRFLASRDELAMLERVREGTLPSFEGVPDAVARVLEHLLTRTPRERLGSARELQIELGRASASVGGVVTSADLAAFLATLDLPPPLDPGKLRAAEPPSSREAASAPPPRASQPVAPSPETGTGTGTGTAGIEASPEVIDPTEKIRPKTSRWLPAAAALVAALAFVLTWGARSLGHARTRLEIRSPTPGAHVAVAGAERGATPLVLEGLRGSVEVVVEGSGHKPYRRTVDLDHARDVILDVTLDPE